MSRSRCDLAARRSGIICATVTPFRPGTHAVDWEAVRQNVDWLIDRGVCTFVVGGSIGEYPSLSREERERLVSETVAAAGDRAVVIAGCTHTDVRAVLDLCRHARDCGARGAMLLLPYYFGLSPDEMLGFFRSVATAIRCCCSLWLPARRRA